MAGWINRLAKRVWLGGSAFSAHVQPGRDEIVALAAAAAKRTAHEPVPSPEPERKLEQPSAASRAPAVIASDLQRAVGRAPAPVPASDHPGAPHGRSPEETAERDKVLRDLLGIEEPKPRRRWWR